MNAALDFAATRRCAACEFFDGGGETRVRRAVETGQRLGGDCLNPRSPRFQTSSLDTCAEFALDASLCASLYRV